MTAKIMGRIEAERPCDLCGNCNLKTAVVVLVDGTLMHIGRDCASDALRLTGSRIDRLVAKGDAESAHARRMEVERVKFRINRISADHLVNSMRNPNVLYGKTRRPRVGSYFMSRKSLIVRVDGTDPDDVAFYADLGFTPSSEPVTA